MGLSDVEFAAPARDAVRYENHIIDVSINETNNPFRQAPGPAVDKAWRDLFTC
jgi:hypothetical protein